MHLWLLLKVDGFGRAGPAALFAFLFVEKQAMMRIYHIGGWDCLGIGDVDGLPVGEIFIIGVWNGHRTVGGANPACRAFFFVYVTGLSAHLHREVANITRNLLQVGIGDDFDVGMSGRLNEPGS